MTLRSKCYWRKDLLAYKNQQKERTIQEHSANTINCQHFPCTDKAIQLEGSGTTFNQWNLD